MSPTPRYRRSAVALLHALLAVYAVSTTVSTTVAAATTVAHPEHAQHPEISRVMPLGALGASDAPSARLVFAAESTSVVAAAAATTEDDEEDASTAAIGFATTTTPGEVANTIKNTVLKIVLYTLLAVKVNTILFVAWWLLKRILAHRTSTPRPS